MPHMIVHYSANLTALDPLELLKDLNTVLLKTELFSVNDIKSRVFKDEVFLIGLEDHQEAYVHLKLYILSGRTQVQKQAAGEALLRLLEQKDYLKNEAEYSIQLCVEVIDMPKENYFKATI
ncbi:5-carboxymethyl-2-hydroxymuconate Delta-isomerase [Acinetobacter sp. LF10]|uniref:5-carboxymethyl-2-hydroxymuconate Delta-isomerase n=1 Tax=Acinetobacter sp. LF10 TaxID=3403576 RepID=UPI003B2172ED